MILARDYRPDGHPTLLRHNTWTRKCGAAAPPRDDELGSVDLGIPEVVRDFGKTPAVSDEDQTRQ